jgi:beta-lactamase regulating signal transducer with metallopeptidase domain
MSVAWITAWNAAATLWFEPMARASWQGSIAVGLAWVLGRALPGLPPRFQCWLWRLAYLKLLLALLWVPPVELPLLPARSPMLSAMPPAATRTVSLSQPADQAFAPTTSPTITPVAGILLLWLLGLGAWGAGLGCACRDTYRLRSAGKPVVDRTLLAISQEQCRGAGLHRPPRLLVTESPGSPLLVGVVAPAILLPVPLLAGCAANELEWIVAHELAHVKRRDLLWNWLPAVAGGLFWFHPLVWLAGAEWHLAQEMACDERVLTLTPATAGDYGEMLVKVAAQSRRQTHYLMTASVIESSRTLRRRLVAMKHVKQPHHPLPARAAAGLALLALVGLVPWRVVAQPASTTPSNQGGRKDLQALSRSRLEQLGRALSMYAQDYDMVLPPMSNSAAAKKALYPYVSKDDAVFLDPQTNQPYEPNARVSGWQMVGNVRIYAPGKNRMVLYRSKPLRVAGRIQILGHLLFPAQTLALYEPRPSSDGTRGVLFLDSHVARVSEADLQRLMKKQN